VSLETLVLVLMLAGYGMQVLFTRLRWLNLQAPEELKESWGPVGRLGRRGLLAAFLLALPPTVAWPCVAAAGEVFPATLLIRIQEALTGSSSFEATIGILFLASLLPMIVAHPTDVLGD
jgi:hypothetical protein